MLLVASLLVKWALTIQVMDYLILSASEIHLKRVCQKAYLTNTYSMFLPNFHVYNPDNKIDIAV